MKSIVENLLYFAGSGDPNLWAYVMTTGGSFNTSAFGSYTFMSMGNPFPLPYPGACPEVSWNQNGTMNPDKKAVLWVLTTGNWSTNTQAVLYAFPALPSSGLFGTPLLLDNTHGPGAVKFSEPTVVNGHVYVAGQLEGTSNKCTTPPCTGMVVSWH